MALIGKIREKSGWTIGIIALGLILFIVGGDILSPTSILRGNNERNVAVINGEKIAPARFDAEMNELRYNYYLNTEKTPTAAEDLQFQPQAWNNLILKTAYQKQFDELGLIVGDEEKIDMVQGRNIHPAILQSFRNPQTGQFDKSYVQRYLQNVPKMDQKQQASWFNFEKQLGPDRLRSKYEALIKKTVYVTTAEAKRDYLSQNTKVSTKYCFIPYSSVQDSEIAMTETVIDEYLANNKAKFPSNFASANIEYVTFPIIASQLDTINFFKEITELKSDFKTSTDDSLFVAMNADKPTIPMWMNPGELPQILSKVSNLRKDSIYGPLKDGNSYKIFKLSDVKEDTAYAARASHILFRWESESAEDKTKALTKCKEVLARIKKGESFETMASQFGTDGTAQQGGDLGWFGQGRMVKEFEKEVFAATKKGLIETPVVTQFGYHILKVTETKTNKKFFVAEIDKTISAGSETLDSVSSKAETLINQSLDADGLDLYLQKNPNIQKVAAPNLLSTATNINNLQNPKELIRWIFTDAKEGNLSSVYEISDNFVVAVLKNKYNAGTINKEAVKYQAAYFAGIDLKAAKIIEKIGSDNTNIEDAAKKAGATAQISNANDLNLATGMLGGAGYEMEAIAVALGLKPNATSKPIKGNGGVLIVQTLSITNAPEITNYEPFKSTILNSSSSQNDFFINEAIRDKAKIEDNRYKYY